MASLTFRVRERSDEYKPRRAAVRDVTSFDAFLAEVFPSLIDGGPREAGIQGRLSDRSAVDLYRPNRLIFELNQIVGIEELVLGKQWIADFFRVAIEGATGAQGLNFFRVGRHRDESVK